MRSIIVAEPGKQYEIEITLTNGFEWGKFDFVTYNILLVRHHAMTKRS
jgi:hypothetical protein